MADPVDRPRAGALQGLTIAFAGFLPVMAILSLAPAVPTIIQHFGLVPRAELIVPLMVTAPGLMIALFAPIAGWIADKYGRRRAILTATFAYGFFGAAPILLHDLTPIFISRFAVGLSEAFILTIVNALFADYFAPDERRKWITVQGVLGPILGIATLMMSGVLTARMWNGAFLIYLSAFVIFAAMAFSFFEPAKARHNTEPTDAGTSSFPWKDAAKFGLVTLVGSTLYYVYTVQAGLAFRAIGVTSSGQLGVLLGIAALGVPIGAIGFNWLSRRWASEWLLASFLLLFSAGLIGMALSNDVTSMTIASFVEQIGAGMAVTSMIFWVSRILRPEHRGRGFGIWTAAFFVGQFVSPAVVGLMNAATGGILATFLVMGVVAAVAGLAIFLLRERLPKLVEA